MTLNDDKSDAELWKGLREGSKADFSALYQRYAKSLFHYGFKITPDKVVVQDAVQDLFIELWNSKSTSTVSHVKFYLFSALRYKIFRTIKAESQLTIENYTDLKEDSVEEEWTFKETETEKLLLLQHGIKELPARQQEALNLKYHQNFSNEDIGKIMDINYQSVSNLLFKALNSLKKKFKLKTY